MKFKKIVEINNARRFVKQISENEFFFLNAEKRLCMYNGSEVAILIKEIKCEIVEQWNGGFLINEHLFYDYSNLKELFNQNIYKSLILSDNKLLVKELDFINEKIKLGLYHYIKNQIKWLDTQLEPISPVFSVTNNTFISYNDLQLSNYDYFLNIIWNLSFLELLKSDKAFLHSTILEMHQKLYFILDGTNEDGLFAVDIKTGKVLYRYNNLYGFLVHDENYIYSTKYENILCKINTITGICEEWDVNTLIKENGFDSISDHRCKAQNAMIYFTQTIGDTKAKLGILNTVKRELVWKYEFEPQNGGIVSIQVYENRIFVQTQDNTLYIFEKEPNA